MAGAISSTGKTNYTTPHYLLMFVRAFFRRLQQQGHCVDPNSMNPIDLDPCSNPDSLVDARVNVMLETNLPEVPVDVLGLPIGVTFVTGDGFKAPVVQNCHQYINPPFGRGVGRWFAKAWNNFKMYNAATILCVPDTPDTNAWTEEVLLKAEGRCQVAHRPKFGGMKAGIPKTIAFLYFGPPEFFEDFRVIFQTLGRVERPRMIYQDQAHVEIWRPTKSQPTPNIPDVHVIKAGES